MADPLSTLRGTIRSSEDAIRWACVLEATAPKAGNVYPGRSFHNLRHADFIVAAEIAAVELTSSTTRISQRMLAAARATQLATGTNVNLGILLLLGPLVAADHKMGDQARAPAVWIEAIRQVIASFNEQDGQAIYDAIAISSAGGLGEAESMDVHKPHSTIDIRSAMTSAKDRDRIALQYATDFTDLFQNYVPIVSRCIEQQGEILLGIARAHVQLLSNFPDTLIARKCGEEVAKEVQRRARMVDVDSADSMSDFDTFLRSDDHRLNPGTTADLIAAALYSLLRTNR